jgi:branched-chain amino acid transport system permease protein
MRDSPAACATLGVNLLSTKLAVFALSAAIAGFGGALIGVARGSASTQNFEMLQGLPLLLLLVVGGTALVSGSLFGGILLQSFTWIVEILPGIKIGNVDVVQTWSRIGPGLAGIGIGRNPEGAVTEISLGRYGEGGATPPVAPEDELGGGDPPVPTPTAATAGEG